MAQLDLTYEACAHRIPLPLPLNLSPTERALVENTWRGRMLNEHASARVFAGLLTQLMAAGTSPRRQAEIATMVQDELRHARLCAGALLSLGFRPVGELPTLTPIPQHEDASSPLEVVLRNVISICCLSETVAVALIDAERRALMGNPLSEVLRTILADEVQHARFGWTLLEELDLDSGLRDRLLPYVQIALSDLERHELEHLAPVCAPAGARAFGACDGALAREIFYSTIEEVIQPRLEQLGLAPGRSPVR